MNEVNPRSVRFYFIFAAIATIAPLVATILRGQNETLFTSSHVASFVFSVLFAYISIHFYNLLRNPALIKGVLIAAMVFTVIQFAWSLRDGLHIKAADIFTVAMGMSAYLLWSVSRLSEAERRNN